MKKVLFWVILIHTTAVLSQVTQVKIQANEMDSGVELVILGNAQDGGVPHMGCKKDCCRTLLDNNTSGKVSALGLIDRASGKAFIFDATPDLGFQWHTLNLLAGDTLLQPSGILLTHAHIGHYTGLMYLGRESRNTNAVPVYALPKMAEFLNNNGPWNQLVALNNISIIPIGAKQDVTLTKTITVRSFKVPHRDEYSETVGYEISGTSKKALFIPDIDKWEKWPESVLDKIKEVDYAFLDGTFYDAAEVGYRDISEIPHPFIVESLSLFESLGTADRKKIYFIHFNHTNPLLNPESNESKNVLNLGFQIAREGMIFKL